MQTKQIKKIAIIIAIYALIASLAFVVIYQVFSPNPSCIDGKLNQNEKEVDCGGVCSPCEEKNGQPLVILEQAVLDGGNGTYDIVAKVKNPNNRVGSPLFSYTAQIKDAAGQILAERKGRDFILPAENKYIAEIGLEASIVGVPQSVFFEINDIQWKTLPDISKPAINIYSKNLSIYPDGKGVLAQALMRNESAYDFAKIKIVVVLRDGAGKIVGLNSTEKDTVRAGEEREFKLTWPYALAGEPKSFEAEAATDLYDSQNFLNKKYETQEFQRYE